MPGFEGKLSGETKFFEYIGVPWLFEQRELLCRLLRGESVPVEGSPFEGRCYTSDEPGWNYVETPGEAEYLLKEVCGFTTACCGSFPMSAAHTPTRTVPCVRWMTSVG